MAYRIDHPLERRMNPARMAVSTNETCIGTCSKCGGEVVLPKTFMSTARPLPTCKSCGATSRQPHRRVIEME